MVPRRLLSIVLVALGVLIAGCVNPPAALDASSPPAARAVTHLALPFESAQGALDEPRVALAGTTAMTGAMRYTPFESFEPTIGVDSNGDVYLGSFHVEWTRTAIVSVRAAVDMTLLAKSTDDGATWTDVTPEISLTGTSWPPQSNDPYVWIDPATDRVFLSDLQALMCSTLSWSDDGGATWTQSTVPCGVPPGSHDHQTIWTAAPRTVATEGYPSVLYYCVNRVADTACATSLDGGATFGQLKPAFPTIIPGIPACTNRLMGHGTAAPDGTTYLAKVHCGHIVIAKTEDDGNTWTWRIVDSTTGGTDHDVEVAVDAAGNVHAAWVGADRLPYVSSSVDGGKKWSKPLMVATPGVGTVSFVALAAGDAGKIAVSYYGTTASKTYANMGAADKWNAYIGVIEDAFASTVVIQTAQLNPDADPVARGDCSGISRCNGVGDFLDLVIDGKGRPWSAMVDVCNDACATASGARNVGVRGFAGTLASGPALRGEGALPPLAG